MHNHKLNLICYVAGPMTGMPDNNYPAFREAEKALQEQGLRTLNPADNRGPTWSDFMRQSLHQIAQCNLMYMLLGWEKSKGAKVEHQLAKDLGITILYQQRMAEVGAVNKTPDPRAIAPENKAQEAALKAKYAAELAQKQESDKLSKTFLGNGPDHPSCGKDIKPSRYCSVQVYDISGVWMAVSDPVSEAEGNAVVASLRKFLPINSVRMLYI